MNKKTIESIIKFMHRTELKGFEVPEYFATMSELHKLLDQADKVKESDGKEVKN